MDTGEYSLTRTFRPKLRVIILSLYYKVIAKLTVTLTDKIKMHLSRNLLIGIGLLVASVMLYVLLGRREGYGGGPGIIEPQMLSYFPGQRPNTRYVVGCNAGDAQGHTLPAPMMVERENFAQYSPWGMLQLRDS